jgi:hypothetical protein
VCSSDLDENFTFKSSSIELLRRAVEIIERINNETTKA